MSSFTDPLTVTKIGKRKWKLHSPFRYYVGEEGSDEFIDVEIGFITDFASVPRPLWTIFPPDGEYTAAAVVHDYLYSKCGVLDKKTYSRKDSDKIFKEAMGVLMVPGLKRDLMYRGVRMFGWIPWNKRKKVING